MSLRERKPELDWEQRKPSRAGFLFAACLCTGLSVVAYQLRVAWIASFFVDRTPLAKNADGSLPKAKERIQQGDPLRIILIDGLGADAATSMPSWDTLCSESQIDKIDVGFPTVSLPVQSALWTGRWQHESGILYRLKTLPTAPADAIPVRVRKSVAIAQDHPEIIGSFGFDQSWTAKTKNQQNRGFWSRAKRALSSDADLVFVHILQVDAAGHQSGAGSKQYENAVEDVGNRLPALVTASARQARAQLWILSDHGHRPSGGHGGAEPEIRTVLRCQIPGVHAIDAPTANTSPRPIVGLYQEMEQTLGLSARASMEREAWQFYANPAWWNWGLTALILVFPWAFLFYRKHSLCRVYPYYLLGVGVLMLGVHWIDKISLSNPHTYPSWKTPWFGIGAAPAVLVVLIVLSRWMRRQGALEKLDTDRLTLFVNQYCTAWFIVSAATLAMLVVQTPAGLELTLRPYFAAALSFSLTQLAIAALMAALGCVIAATRIRQPVGEAARR